MDKLELIEKTSRKIRMNICKMTHEAKSGHPGGSLSVADILTCLYFGGSAKLDSKNPDWAERDYVILSKGHAAPAIYSTLAEAGYFPKEDLLTLRKLGSPLQGHPDMRSVPGIELSTGSLGQGLSGACGIASGLKLENKDNRVFCILGDGEIQEGQVWEAAMYAAHYKLNNLMAVVDRNSLQIDGPTEEVMGLGDIEAKFKAFGWKTMYIDGHNFEEILDALDKKHIDEEKPLFVLANTTKGKGVSFMEGKLKFHGVAPTYEECAIAIEELS